MTPVPFVEYVNVRIKGYHSRLFGRDAYEDLLAGDNLGTISTVLLADPRYREDVEGALERFPEREGLEAGVTGNFSRCVSELRDMSGGRHREMVDIALHSFDLKNLRTLIVAHMRKTPAARVRDMIVPCGAISRGRLDGLLAAPNLHALAAALKPCCAVAGESLEAALGERVSGESAVDLVNRVERTMYRRILAMIEGDGADRNHLRTVYRIEIDLRNITAALKHVWEGLLPGQQHFSPYTRGGTVGTAFLEEMTAVGALDEAFEMLEATPFHEAVEKGIIYYAETGFLHEMERFFEEVFIRKTQAGRRVEPFSIAVFVAYLWGHYVEMTNLRAIINGISFHTGAGQIRKGLIHV